MRVRVGHVRNRKFLTLQTSELILFVPVCSMVLTQPGTPMSFQGMLCLFVYLFSGNFRTPTFLISRNSGL